MIDGRKTPKIIHDKEPNMKQFTVLLLLVSLFAGMAFAQLPSFGLKGGINMANIYGSDAGRYSSKMKLGGIGGAFICLDLMALKLQPEVLYSQKGFKWDYAGTNVTERLDYLEIPVLLKFSFGKIVVPSIYFGPSIGVLLSAKESAQSQTVDFKEFCNSTDYGLVLGAEIKTPAKLSVEARYNLGLGNVFKPILSVQPEIKNSAISVMLGYYLF
jgi:hypothetical protein